MINLHQVLSTTYADRKESQIYDWLQFYSLAEPLQKTVAQLNKAITDQSTLLSDMKSIPVGHIASNLLLAVNQRIIRENNPDIVAELENTMSDICLGLLKEFFSHIKTDKKAIILQIDLALKDTCDFHNYDYHQLVRLLNLDSFISYLQTLKNSERIITGAIPAYCWKGKPAEKADFLNILTERNLVRSKKRLALLLENPNQPLGLAFNPALANLTLQLFYTLKKLKLLSPTAAGFYQVLQYHVLDFEKDFLKNKTPRARLNSLRQSKLQWNDNQQRIDKWLQSLWVPATGLRTVHST